MRKIRTLLILGVFISLLPYLGFPYFLKNILISLSGISVIYFSYVLYRQNTANKKPTYENFSENTDFNEEVMVTEEELTENQ